MLAPKCAKCGGEPLPALKYCRICQLTERLAEAQKKSRPTLFEAPAAPSVKGAAPRPAPEPELINEPKPEPVAPHRYSTAVTAGVHHGLQGDTHAILSGASKFAATLGSVPHDVGAAQAFFNYNQKHFYNHMRVMLKALDGRKKLPGRKRKTKPVKKPPVGADSAPNKRLAIALRFLRIYLQVEQKPLALMLGKSQAAIWHIECAHHNIQPHIVAAYADALNVDPASIYKYANALGRGPAKEHDAADMVTKFVDCVLRNKGKPSSE